MAVSKFKLLAAFATPGVIGFLLIVYTVVPALRAAYNARINGG